MQEALTVLLRQLLLIYGTYLVSSGRLDPELLQPYIGFGLAGFSVAWMIFDRFIYPKILMYIVTKDHNEDTVVIKTNTKDTPIPEAIKLLDSKTVVTSTTADPITVISNA